MPSSPLFIVLSIGRLVRQLQCTQLFVPNRFSSRRRGKRGDHSNANDSDDSDDEEIELTDAQFNDPHYNEDSSRYPNFRHLTTHVQSMRFDRILRSGLNLTRSVADDAFFHGNLYLNDRKVLKKGITVDNGDRLDMLLSEEMDRRYGNRVRVLSSTKQTNSHKVVLRCWRAPIKLNSTSSKMMADTFGQADRMYAEEDLVEHSVEQRVLLYPTDAFQSGLTYVVTAPMRGRHIAVTGPLALQPFNVTFEIFSRGNVKPSINRNQLQPTGFKACVTLTSSKQILPRRTLRGQCHHRIQPPRESRSVRYGRLEWAKRTDLFTANRCNNRIRLHTDFHLAPSLLPVLKERDIAIVSFRLRFLVALVFVLLVFLLVFGSAHINLKTDRKSMYVGGYYVSDRSATSVYFSRF